MPYIHSTNSCIVAIRFRTCRRFQIHILIDIDINPRDLQTFFEATMEKYSQFRDRGMLARGFFRLCPVDHTWDLLLTGCRAM